MTTITRSTEREIVEIERLSNGEVSLKQIHPSMSTATFEYTPAEAVRIAHALLDAAGSRPNGGPLAAEAWEAAAEENEHTRQRQQRAVTHTFDIDSPERYAWVVAKEGAAPNDPAWLGLWDRRDDVVAEFRNGLTDDGRRRTMDSLAFLIWNERRLCPVFEIEVR